MYVMRDEEGNIAAVFATEQSYASEFLPMDNPELAAYMAQFNPLYGRQP